MTTYKVQAKGTIQLGNIVIHPNQDFDAIHLPTQDRWLVNLGNGISVRIPKDMMILNVTNLQPTPEPEISDPVPLETTGSVG
jgi:hypothetical protein